MIMITCVLFCVCVIYAVRFYSILEITPHSGVPLLKGSDTEEKEEVILI